MKKAKILFQKLPFYNVSGERSDIKPPTNINLLHELSFYDGLSIYKISKAFKGYTRSYKIEIVDSKDSLA